MRIKCPSDWHGPSADSESRAGSRLILGLDLGTNCGYCCGYVRKDGSLEVEPWYMGQWDLSAGPYDSGAIRFVRLRRFLELVQPNLVAYEDVKFTPAEALSRMSAAAVMARAATAAELIGAFRATVVTWCEEKNVPCTGFSIGQIKKRATGKGNASKAEMISACNAQFGTSFPVENYESTGVDNVADAAFVCLLAYEQISLGLK